MLDDAERSKRYSRIKNRLALVGILLPILFLLIVLFGGFSTGLRELVLSWTDNFYLAVVVYLVALAAAFYAITFPLEFYEGFVLEHKFSLSNQSLFSWIKDEVKRTSISAGLSLPLVLLVYFFLKNFSAVWWILTALAWITFTILLSKFAPIILLPLFFKSRPLKDEALKERLTRLFQRTGTRVREVFELELSRKTKKANAALCGIGKTRRVLLGDTLLQDYSHDEIEVVLAHELGHHKLLHIWKLLFFGVVSTFAGLYIVSLVLRGGVDSFGFEGISDIAAFPILALAISCINILVMPIQNAYTRHLERSADRFALEATDKADAFVSVMDRLWRQNLQDPSPSRFVELMLYNHPPIARRIKMAEEFKAKSV